jgi:hypothetical protein
VQLSFYFFDGFQAQPAVFVREQFLADIRPLEPLAEFLLLLRFAIGARQVELLALELEPGGRMVPPAQRRPVPGQAAQNAQAARPFFAGKLLARRLNVLRRQPVRFAFGRAAAGFSKLGGFLGRRRNEGFGFAGIGFGIFMGNKTRLLWSGAAHAPSLPEAGPNRRKTARARVRNAIYMARSHVHKTQLTLDMCRAQYKGVGCWFLSARGGQ